MKKITRKRRHEVMLENGMHAGNTDAKFDPPPEPKSVEPSIVTIHDHAGLAYTQK